MEPLSKFFVGFRLLFLVLSLLGAWLLWRRPKPTTALGLIVGLSEAHEAATKALFEGDVRSLSEDMLRDVFADVPHSQHAKNLLSAGASLVDVLAETTLANSKREARQFLQAGAVLVNGEKVGVDAKLTSEHLLHGHTILLKRGKKLWHATQWK